jgi:hypothetical protein
MMTTRIDHTELAAKLNYSVLDEKLEQLARSRRRKKRKQVGDVLAPVAEKLRELRAKGWSYEQPAKELSEAGMRVKPSTLRDHLGKVVRPKKPQRKDGPRRCEELRRQTNTPKKTKRGKFRPPVQLESAWASGMS